MRSLWTSCTTTQWRVRFFFVPLCAAALCLMSVRPNRGGCGALGVPCCSAFETCLAAIELAVQSSSSCVPVLPGFRQRAGAGRQAGAWCMSLAMLPPKTTAVHLPAMLRPHPPVMAATPPSAPLPVCRRRRRPLPALLARHRLPGLLPAGSRRLHPPAELQVGPGCRVHRGREREHIGRCRGVATQAQATGFWPPGWGT